MTASWPEEGKTFGIPKTEEMKAPAPICAEPSDMAAPRKLSGPLCEVRCGERRGDGGAVRRWCTPMAGRAGTAAVAAPQLAGSISVVMTIASLLLHGWHGPVCCCFVGGVGVCRDAAAVDGDDVALVEDELADRAEARILARPRVHPTVEARPAVEVAARGDDGFGRRVEADVAIEERAAG